MPRRQPRRPSMGFGLCHGVDLLHEGALLGDDALVAAGGLEAGDLDVEGTRALQELMQRTDRAGAR